MQPVDDSKVTDRQEQWRNFYATQLERQTAAAEVTAKKIKTVELQLSALLALLVVGTLLLVVVSALG
jgi:hypothetical protein